MEKSRADDIYFDEDGITEQITLRINCLPGTSISARFLRSSKQDLNFSPATTSRRIERLFRVGTHIWACNQTQAESLIPITGAVVFDQPALIEYFSWVNLGSIWYGDVFNEQQIVHTCWCGRRWRWVCNSRLNDIFRWGRSTRAYWGFDLFNRYEDGWSCLPPAGNQKTQKPCKISKRKFQPVYRRSMTILLLQPSRIHLPRWMKVASIR